MGDMSYFANLAKKYALQSLDLSNTHFNRSGRLNDTEKSVSERMFFGSTCSNIAIPSNTVYIRKETFADCNQLTCFTIPQSVRYIGDRAFAGLHTKELHVEWMVPPILKEGFITKGCSLYVPKGCVDKYKSEKYWKDCDQILEEP